MAPIATAPNAPPYADAYAALVDVAWTVTEPLDASVARSVVADTSVAITASDSLPPDPTSEADTPTVTVFGTEAIELVVMNVSVETSFASVTCDVIVLPIVFWSTATPIAAPRPWATLTTEASALTLAFSAASTRTVRPAVTVRPPLTFAFTVSMIVL